MIGGVTLHMLPHLSVVLQLDVNRPSVNDNDICAQALKNIYWKFQSGRATAMKDRSPMVTFVRTFLKV